MVVINARTVLHLILAIVMYVTIVIDFTWWSLIQKEEISSTEFDFIVIGGGSGGSTAAGRLAENGSFNVLLLEAGASPSPLNKIPLMGMASILSPYDWQYLTEPQNGACLAMNEQRSCWPSGKILGGSSQLNFMMYIRGQPKDYDRWGELNPGWSYEDVLPFFERSITYTGKKDYLGKNGPWHIVRSNGITSLDHMFVEAGQVLGYRVLDVNSESGPGLYYTDSNQRRGYRHSLSDAFLQDRSNLHVLTNALVDKVNFVDDRADGVTFTKFGETVTVKARREIIVSAGAVSTPTVLLRSGVGPIQHLEEMGIPQVADLPVGLNLASHIGTMLSYQSREPTNLIPSTVVSAIREYVQNGTGPVSASACDSGLFHVTSESEAADWPDLQVMLANLHPWLIGAGGFQDLNLRQEPYDEGLSELNNTVHGISLFPYLLRPRSRGHVRLSSTDPAAPPVIQPNFLQHPADVRTLVEGLRLAALIADTPPLSGSLIRRVVYPPCRGLAGDDQLECQVRQLTLTIYHPVGTCRMAPRAAGGVVDHQLRVHGLRGLRVMDASVMPNITSGNTNAPVVMIAEKGADMILRGL